MPETIPYDPSLELANVIPQDKLNTLIKIAELEAPIEAAEDELNSAIQTLRSLDMTLSEMANMGIDISDLQKKREEAGNNIKEAASKVVNERLTKYKSINKEKANLGKVSKSIESPVDYNKTQIKKMPLSADSIKMDAQYFSFDEENQSAENAMSAIKSFVAAQTSVLGSKKSAEASSQAHAQVSKQRENHNLEGTLVITATCTHKDAALLAPFVLDVDKAIRVWNSVFSDDMIKTNSVKSMQEIAEKQETEAEKMLKILSGATYGSSFVGMVHVLRKEETSANQTMLSAAASMQAQMETGNWFSSMSGGFGVDSQFANDVKRMLSSQQISSHISVISMGAIPSIKSNEVAIGVKQFADFDPAKMMDKLATLANATAADQKSVQEGAQAARTGQQMVQIRASEIKSVMTGLGQVDDGKNKMLDINSLMTALEDYVQQAIGGNIGIPITYYIKSITKSQLAQMWVAKYFPGQYLTAAGDDTKPKEPDQNEGTEGSSEAA